MYLQSLKLLTPMVKEIDLIEITLPSVYLATQFEDGKFNGLGDTFTKKNMLFDLDLVVKVK